MPLLSTRDQSLDLNLESDARLIAISIGIALALLVFGTLAIVYLLPVCRSVWRTIGIPRPIQNPSATPESFQPAMASTPAEKLNLPRTFPYPPGIAGPPPKQKPVTFFTSTSNLRKSSTVSDRPAALYNGITSFATPTKPRPAFQTRNHTYPPRTPRQPPKQPSGAAPHLVGWMQVADEVVGSHPNAVPLHERVATPEEIALISGHVHIPWVLTESTDHRPIVINIYRPPPAVPAYPDLPGPSTTLARHQNRIDQLESGVLGEIGNIRRARNVPVDTGTISKPIPIQYKKEKSTASARGRVRDKENAPPQAGPSSKRGPRVVARI